MGGTSVVFDIETQNLINEMPGIDRESKIKMLEVSCLSYLVLPSDELLLRAVVFVPPAPAAGDRSQTRIPVFQAALERAHAQKGPTGAQGPCRTRDREKEDCHAAARRARC